MGDTLTTAGGKRVRWWGDALGVGWVVAAGAGTLLPALAHGASLGPFDLLGLSGLSRQAGTHIHSLQVNDQIQQFVPWTTLAWHEVHSGHLPLWNPDSVLGLPLAFNWQASAFSLPALFGYLAPVRLAYTVQVVTTMVIAGTGAYALSRVVRVGVVGSMMAGTLFELSGPFINWLGWPNASVMSWSGWLFAAALVVVGGRHRTAGVVSLAVVLAGAVYAGQPEMTALLLLSLVLFVAVVLLVRRRGDPGAAVLHPMGDLGAALVAGLALGAPLLLPGLQLLAGSARQGATYARAFPLHDLTHVLLQGFDPRSVGLPIDPIESAAYVGAIGVVLAMVAVVVRRHEPAVVALAAVAALTAGLSYVPAVAATAVALVPSTHAVHWRYDLLPLALAVAVLAGVGTDAVVHGVRGTWGWAAAGFVAVAVVVGLLWLFGRGHLPPTLGAERARSFVWPTVETVVGLAVVGGLALVHRRRRRSRVSPRGLVRLRVGGAAILVGCETAFLVSVGAPLWSSSPRFFTTTAGEAAFLRTVGSSVVGLGARDCRELDALGFIPDVNVAYGVREFAVYDPMVPSAFALSFARRTGTAVVPDSLGFCPAVTSAAVARTYGVAFVLEPLGAPGPAGTVFDRTVGGEELYRVPGAAAATVAPLGVVEKQPPQASAGAPVAVTHPGPASWKLSLDDPGPGLLRLRLTDVPGWHATVDGRPLTLSPFDGVMLQAHVPAGRHTVELHYWPNAFTIGLVLAAVAALAVVVDVVAAASTRGRR